MFSSKIILLILRRYLDRLAMQPISEFYNVGSKNMSESDINRLYRSHVWIMTEDWSIVTTHI